MAANIPNFPSRAGFGRREKQDARGCQPGIPLTPSPSSKLIPNAPQMHPCLVPGCCTRVCIGVHTCAAHPSGSRHARGWKTSLSWVSWGFFLAFWKASFLPAAPVPCAGAGRAANGSWGIKRLVPSVRHRVKEPSAPRTAWPAPAPRRITGKRPGQTVLPPRENSTLPLPAGTRRAAEPSKQRAQPRSPLPKHPQTMGAGKISWGNDAAGMLHPRRIFWGNDAAGMVHPRISWWNDAAGMLIPMRIFWGNDGAGMLHPRIFWGNDAAGMLHPRRISWGNDAAGMLDPRRIYWGNDAAEMLHPRISWGNDAAGMLIPRRISWGSITAGMLNPRRTFWGSVAAHLPDPIINPFPALPGGDGHQDRRTTTATWDGCSDAPKSPSSDDRVRKQTTDLGTPALSTDLRRGKWKNK